MKVTHIGPAVFHQLERAAVEYFELVRRMSQLGPLEAEPAHVILDVINVFRVFLRGVGIVETQDHLATEFAADAEVQVNGFGVAYVKVTVGLGWEARAHSGMPVRRQVLADDLTDEVVSSPWVRIGERWRGGHRAGGVGTPA